MKQKFIRFLILTWVLGLFAVPANGQEPIEGWWEIEKKSSKIFTGAVRIVYVKSRPGSRYQKMPIIYDEEQFGLLCSGMEKQTFICGAAEINKKELTADDQTNLVTHALPDLPPFEIKLDLRENKLEISGRPLTAEPCDYSDSCSYHHWVTLKRKQDPLPKAD